LEDEWFELKPVRSGRVEYRKMCMDGQNMSAHITSIHEAGLKYMRSEITVAVFLRIQVFWDKIITHKHEKLRRVNSQ